MFYHQIIVVNNLCLPVGCFLFQLILFYEIIQQGEFVDKDFLDRPQYYLFKIIPVYCF